ncbi:MAG: HDIG domain-containing protein [Bacteroidetes bacterium]|nr:HDIG domain-containing protein [Bacteroidota bacterium]
MGGTLEAGDSAAVRKRRRRQLAVKVGLMLSLVVVTMVAFPRGTVYQYTVRMDEIWRQPNLHAPFTFAVNKPDAVVQAEREAVRRSTPHIFSREEAAAERVQAQAIQLRQHMDRILTHYGRFVLNTTSGRMEEALRDSIAFDASRDSMSLSLTRTEWEAILTSYVSQTSGRITSSRSELPGERLDRLVVREAESVVLSLMPDGIVNISRGAITSDSLIVRSDASREERLLASSSIRDVSLALEAGRDQLQQRFPGQAVTRQIAEAVFGQLLPPNLIFDQRQTQDRLARREAEILPTEGIVRENEVIVRQGDRVTPDIMRKIDSLQEQLILQSGNRVAWKTKMGHFLVTIATLMIFFLYLYLLRKPIFEDNAMITLITLLFLGVIAVFGVALRAALIDMYVVPVAIVAIVLTVIFDSRVAFFGSLTLALTGSHLLNYDFGFTFATVFASALGIFSVRDIRNRSQFFLSASVVFVGYMLVLTANLLLQGTPTDRFVDLTIFVAINSVLLLLAYPALWIFERVFDVTTDLTLLELSDTNRPLLKELSMKAPGTFNHVLQVANLAETAAASIGANALLTRVGALYHDIGKMVKPEYFVENQRGGVNPHDGLKPRMSALIIASHVKEGIDMARKNRLPKVVEDFIPMHHGTMRIEYFYHRALKQHKEGEPAVQESEFRYPGPRPRSKETSILMLADGVEAASRSLDNPSHKRLEGLIDSIVEARREDGQLDETDLTFAELRTIKQALLGVLTGIYHVRVKYPEDDGEDGASWSGDQAADALNG